MRSILSIRFPQLLAVAAAAALFPVWAANPVPEQDRIGGFVLGTQAGCFKNFSVYEAIEKSAQAGSRFIEFSFRLKKLSQEKPKVAFGIDLPDAEIQLLKEKLKEHGIRPVNYGAVPIPA